MQEKRIQGLEKKYGPIKRYPGCFITDLTEEQWYEQQVDLKYQRSSSSSLVPSTSSIKQEVIESHVRSQSTSRLPSTTLPQQQPHIAIRQQHIAIRQQHIAIQQQQERYPKLYRTSDIAVPGPSTSNILVSNVSNQNILSETEVSDSAIEKMAKQFTFVAYKAGGKWYMKKFMTNDEKVWRMIKEDQQESSHHGAVMKEVSVIEQLNIARNKKKFDITLSESDQKPYLDGSFEDKNYVADSEESDADNTASAPPLPQSGQTTTDPAILAILAQLTKGQEQQTKILDQLTKQRTVKPQKMEINKFSGKNEDPSSWLVTYENMCTVNGWTTPSMKIHNMKAYMEGAASSWYMNRVLQRKPDDYDDWKESLTNAFKQNRIQLAWNALHFEYRGGQLLDYYFEKQRLLNMAFPKMDDYSFISLVLMGLPRDMQDQAMQNVLDTRDDLLKALEKLRPTSKKQHSSSSQSIGNTSGGTQPPNKQTSTKRYPPKKEKTNIEKSNSVQDESAACVESINEAYSDETKMYQLPVLQLKINGHLMNCLVDSGATINMISAKKCAHIGDRIDESDKRILVGFDGNKVSSTGKLKVTITNGSEEVDTVASVVTGLNFDFIIGYTSFNQLGIKLDFPGKENQVNTASDVPTLTKAMVINDYPQLVVHSNIRKYSVPFKLKNDAKVVKEKYFRMSRDKQAWSQEKIKDYKAKDQIEDSSSDHSSPTVIVPKENGTLRMCVDYRKINEETELDPFPFPLIDDIICNFGGCKFFSKIDLKDGFHLIGLTEETRKYTSFVTPFGQYQWKVLPFGWKNSPPIFQRIMTQCLSDLLEDRRVSVYIDDIIVGSETIDGLIAKTRQVLSRLQEHGFQINLEKSEFCQPSVTFLGRIIDGKTKTTKEESVDKVRNMKRPHDLHTVRVFTGLASHFRGFIKDFAKLIRPIDRLKQKDVLFVWTDECEKSFVQLKEIITSNPILQLPDWNLPFELCCDASDKGSGSILYQRDVKEKRPQQLRVIGYQSYTFNKHELNYSVTDKEGLAVIKAIKYFRSYLESRPFKVHTDHQALSHILGLKEPKGRLGRWQTFLLSYNVDINHRSGKELKDADAISRLCLDTKDNPDETAAMVNVVISSRDGKRIFINEEGRNQVLRRYHDDPDSGGHDGMLRTYLKIRSRFYWPGLKQDVIKYVRSCHDCQINKSKFKPRPDIMILPNHAKVPYETVHLDFGELQKKGEGRKLTKSFIVLVDESTRYVDVKAMNESSRSVINFLKSRPYLSKIKKIVVDNGKGFDSKDMKDFTTANNIVLKFIAPFHPAANGLAERRMRDLKTFIKLYPKFKGGWKECLQAAANHINRSYCTAIGCSPIFKLTGQSKPFPADEEYNIPSDLIQETPLTDDQVLEKRKKSKMYFDQNHAKNLPDLKIGDSILVQTGFKGKHPNISLNPNVVKDIKFMDGFPKTILYEDENGTQKVASIGNVFKYHRRSDVQS